MVAADLIRAALVDADELVAANSGIWTAAVLSQIVLAPAAAALVVGVAYPPAFGINAASSAISAPLIARLRLPRPPRPAAPPARWTVMARDGVRLLTHDRLL